MEVSLASEIPSSLRGGGDDLDNLTPTQLQRRLEDIDNLERFCKPQHLSLYDPVNNGLKYSVIGLFGLPDPINKNEPCVYSILASVFPPGEPYKKKPAGSMFGASYFAEVDFERSRRTNQYFR